MVVDHELTDTGRGGVLDLAHYRGPGSVGGDRVAQRRGGADLNLFVVGGDDVAGEAPGEMTLFAGDTDLGEGVQIGAEDRRWCD